MFGQERNMCTFDEVIQNKKTYFNVYRVSIG